MLVSVTLAQRSAMFPQRTILARGWMSLLWIMAAAPCGLADPPQWNRDIAPLLTKYCVGCHNAQDSEAELQMHTLAALRRGGVSGAAIVPGDTDASLLWRRVSGIDEPRMPPEGEAQPTDEERKRLEAWIAAGAIGTDAAIPLSDRWTLPRSRTRYAGELPITAAAVVGPNQDLWLGRPGDVELQQGNQRRKLDLEIIGKVTQIRTSRDCRWVTVATGIPGVGGQTILIDASSLASHPLAPRVVRRIEGHQDIVYAAAIDPSNTVLATAGYDRVIHLWDLGTGQPLRSLEGHNGAVYDLEFDDSGKVLLSASADETVKVWRVDTGERLDTLGQGEAEQYTVRWDARRGTILAAGGDRRVRVWKLGSTDKPTVSPLIRSVFAHEEPVNQLSPSPDGRWIATAGEDRRVKIWNADSWDQVAQLEPLDDIASAVLWNESSDRLLTISLSGQRIDYDLRGTPQIVSTGSPTASAIAQKAAVPPGESQVRTVDESPEKRSPSNPQRLEVPAIVRGSIAVADMQGLEAGDWYALDATQGDEWILTIDASRSGSRLDSMLDICDAHGDPLPRTRLQAVRESYFTFRGNDSTNIDDFRLHSCEDTELNQYLYAAGEVVKLWLYPRGPDSGYKVYPGYGKRITYWDTTATTHALNEPAWIVEEIAPGREPASNGLPVFAIYYTNDDDATRRGDKDSRLHFTAPRDGTYLVRVRDARGEAGDAYNYKLSIERPHPRFQFRVEQGEIALRPKVGSEFSVAVERFDGLDDPIDIEWVDLPEGLIDGGKLTVEREQGRAIGQLRMTEDAATKLGPSVELTLRARAMHRGAEIAAESEAKLKVALTDKHAMPLKVVARDATPDSPPLQELRIRPGTTATAILVIERGELQGDIAFGGDDCGRNLPHGCFVDNIGLNGLLIPAGQSTRELFITASPITARGERVFHLRALVDGNPTTLPIRLVVE